MIVKMKFINISGPRDDIDRVTDLYLSRYEIQLESALSELKTVDNLRPFVELNPYRDVLAQATQFVGYLPNVDDVTPDESLGLDDMFEVVRKACEDYEGLQPNSNCSPHSAPSTVIFTRSSDIDILHIVSDGSHWNLITR